MALLDRHVAFLRALRDAGLPVSLAEGLDAVRAIDALGLGEREALRAAYAATLVKRAAHRPGFDPVFDLYRPALVGDGARSASDGQAPGDLADGPAQLEALREALATALALGDPDALESISRDAVARFGRIRGRGPGEQRWSAYNAVNRVSASDLVDRVLTGRAFTRFAAQHPDALTPRTNLLILGDARSNHSDLALPVVADLVHAARRSWWLNPEHPRDWDTGDSAAGEYGRLLPMLECRNLTQLSEFVHDLA